MARSLKKGPFVAHHLRKKAEVAIATNDPKPIKTWSRGSTILPEWVNLKFAVHNGMKHLLITVSENMVGHKLGEFAQTRTYKGHAADSKAKR